jgi:hypothetical protein
MTGFEPATVGLFEGTVVFATGEHHKLRRLKQSSPRLWATAFAPTILLPPIARDILANPTVILEVANCDLINI